MRSIEELKIEVERKGVQQFHLFEVLLDIRELCVEMKEKLSEDKKKK